MGTVHGALFIDILHLVTISGGVVCLLRMKEYPKMGMVY